MRIAVIGSGISGLTCASLLHGLHDVDVYESGSWVGGHTHTVDVALSEQDMAVDTGFIVYNDRTYPNFIRLLDKMGIQGRATRMSFSVHNPQSGLEYCGTGINGLFSQRRNILNPRFLQMLRDVLRFNREAETVLQHSHNPSLSDYLAANNYGSLFQENYLLPMAAAIWSGPVGSMGEFPIQQFVRFFDNHGLLQVRDRPQWRVIPGGSRSYVEKLVEPFRNQIRLNTPVQRVSRHKRGAVVEFGSEAQNYDQVIFACHSDQALALLGDASEREQDILGAIPYQENDVVLHTDASLLPSRRRSLAAWNYRLTGNPEVPATVTYHMNTLQGFEAREDVCVTLNQTASIAPESILGRWAYTHPVFNRASVAAQARREEIDGTGYTHFCGAYWHNGFHEDGVRSALPVVQRFGGGL